MWRLLFPAVIFDFAKGCKIYYTQNFRVLKVICLLYKVTYFFISLSLSLFFFSLVTCLANPSFFAPTNLLLFLPLSSLSSSHSYSLLSLLHTLHRLSHNQHTHSLPRPCKPQSFTSLPCTCFLFPLSLSLSLSLISLPFS